MNKRGQNLLFAIITGIMIFIAGMLILNHVMADVTLARSVGLDCSNVDISDGTKLTCFGVDLVIPILILTIVSVSLGAILSRFII
jgi:hypothetical protein